MSKDSLGDRMKGYEVAARTTLPHRLPIIIRIDGKAFHTYTRGLARPFDSRLGETMLYVAKKLCAEIQSAQLAYAQSDEISILVHGYKKFDSESWFDNQVQKMTSVAASIAGAEFTARSWYIFSHMLHVHLELDNAKLIRPAYFDARAFIVPEADVCNYFLWRQQDATRNSVQMLARSLYSHKDLDGMDNGQLQELCFAKGQNWNDLETRWKRGACVHRVFSQGPVGGWQPGDPEPVARSAWEVDYEIPVFSQDREYVNKHLQLEES